VTALLSVTLFVCLLAVCLVLVLKERPLTAPEWVRYEVETRLAVMLPEVQVRFDSMVLAVGENWFPQVQLRNVRVATTSGEELVQFNDLSTSVALSPLLQGEVRPGSVRLSGIFARLRRTPDGRVVLSGGQQAGAPAKEAATLPQLIGQIDAFLQRPALNALKDVEIRALTLRYDDLRAQRAWTLDGGRLLLSREGNDLSLFADLAVLGGGTGVATMSASYDSVIGETSARFGVQFEGVPASDIAVQGPAFAWLDALRAPISGAVRTGLSEDGTLEPLSATLQIGEGAVQPAPDIPPVPFHSAQSYFSYDPDRQSLSFDALSVKSDWLSGEATGTASIDLTEGGALDQLVGQIRLADVSANPLSFYDTPAELEEAEVDFRLRLNPFHVTLGRVQISDQGNMLQADAQITAAQQGWEVSVNAHMDAVAPERVLQLWPEQVMATTRAWLADNLMAAGIENINLALRRSSGRPPQDYLTFDYNDARVRFMNTLPPLTQASGQFSLVDRRLVISVDEGHVVAPQGGPVDIAGSSFIVPQVGIRNGAPSVTRLEASSDITAALSLLNQPPMQAMDKASLPVALADGFARVSGTLAMLLTRPGEKRQVIYHMRGVLEDVYSDVLVKDRTLSASDLTFAANNQELAISGIARLDGVPVVGTWSQQLGPDADGGRLEGDIVLSEQTLDAFGISLPPDTVSGRGAGRVSLTLARGAAPMFNLSSDLEGIRLSVPQVNWVKPAARTGLLRLEGQLGTAPRVNLLEVEGPGLSARGSVDLREDGALDRVSLEDLRVGNWLNIPLDLVGRGAGNPVQVVLRGGSLDLRTADFGETGAAQGPPSPPMRVALDRLQITDAIALTDVQGVFQTSQGLSGEFQARLNGEAPVKGVVVPQNGRSAIRMVSSDAGGVLRSAGLLRQVSGGNLSLLLLPVGSEGAFDGQLTITDVRVKDAPGIAALVNAVSVVGLINELSGDGIYFDTVQGRFRLTSDQLTLTEASAVGASMGLSMDGIYRLDTGQIDMQGAISPVYLLNGIGSVLTRSGEGLFGFNYTLKGPAQTPSVSINPLSALTPAMFREIFRAPPPDLPAVEGNTQSVLPQTRPDPAKPVVETFEGR
jgi:hypothetical protein